MCVSSGDASTGQQEPGGVGGGARPGDSGGFPAQPPAHQPSMMPSSRKAHRELAMERLKLPRQLADARLTLRVPWQPQERLSVRGEGCMWTHTCVLGQWNIPASSPPTAPSPHCLGVRVEPQTLLRVPAKLLSGAGTWGSSDGYMGWSWHCQPCSYMGELFLSPRVTSSV